MGEGCLETFAQALPYHVTNEGYFCSGTFGVDRKYISPLAATQSVLGCAHAVSVDSDCSTIFYYATHASTGDNSCRCVMLDKTCLRKILPSGYTGAEYSIGQAI